MMPVRHLPEGVEKKGYGEADLFRNCSLEQIPSVWSGNQQLDLQVSNSSSIHLQTLHGYTSGPVWESLDSKHESAAVA